MLDHVALQVADVDVAVAFYSRVFAAAGVSEAMRFDDPHGPTVGLAGPDGMPHLWLGPLVDPGVPVPPGIAELTGINDSMLAAAPRLGAVLPRLLEFSRGCVLVAHNAPFDLRFLVAGCGECGVAWPGFTVLDTVMLARRVMDPDEVADCKLGTLAAFFGARTAPSHRALADARATADVLSWLVRRLEHRGIRTIQQLSAWPDVVA